MNDLIASEGDLSPLLSFDQQFSRKTNETVRESRRQGVYSHTAWQVKSYFDTARQEVLKNRQKGGSKGKSRLQFHRFDGTGFFQFRFREKGAKKDGIAFENLFIGNQENSHKRLIFLSRDDSQKTPRLRMRATLSGSSQIKGQTRHEFDVLYHRPIPEGSSIQNGQIIRARTGDRFTYHLVLTVKQPLIEPETVPNDKAIGVDIGFRQDGGNIRVAAIHSSEKGGFKHIAHSQQKMLKAIKHVIALESALDETATELGKIIKPLFKAHPMEEEDNKRYRFWKKVARAKPNVTFSFETAYKLARFILFQKGHFPEEAEREIIKWWRANSRKYREHHNLQRKCLTHRKHVYRQLASELVKHKQIIAVEKINLTAFAETKDKDNKLKKQARSQRFIVSPSEFRDAIKNAANREGIPYIEVPAPYTSKTCGDCGAVNKKLKSEMIWKCPKCGEIHDRDLNAARVIAKRGIKEYNQNRKKGGG